MSIIAERLHQAIAPALDYWRGMPTKDRRALTLLAAIIIPVTVIWGGLVPAKQVLSSAQLARQEAVTLASTIRNEGPRLRGGSSERIAVNELAQRIQALAAAQTLKLDRLESDPSGVRIALSNASVRQLTLFLQQCRAQGVAVKEVVINQAGAGANTVRVRLSV